jgi:excisionase family DNA binding protein
MRKDMLPQIPGYITVDQAARLLGLSTRRVYEFIERERLPAVRAGQNILLPLEAVQQFKPKMNGRPRKSTPAWHAPRSNGAVQTSIIRVKVRPDQQEKLRLKLWKIKQEKRHTFPGSLLRLIMREETYPDIISILLAWESNNESDDKAIQMALKDFQQELADVLVWETAKVSLGTAIIYT